MDKVQDEHMLLLWHFNGNLGSIGPQNLNYNEKRSYKYYGEVEHDISEYWVKEDKGILKRTINFILVNQTM